MTTDTVKNAKMTTESVVDFVFFETLTTEKSATEQDKKTINQSTINLTECDGSSELSAPRIILTHPNLENQTAGPQFRRKKLS